MRYVLGVLLVTGFTLMTIGCGDDKKAGPAVTPTGLIPTPKEGPKAVGAGVGGAKTGGQAD